MKLASFSVFMAALAKANAAGLRAMSEDPALVLPVVKCSPENPCDVCMGDCDKDADCMEGLYCYQKHGKAGSEEEAMVPGCSGLDFSKTDWCVKKEEVSTPTCNADGTPMRPDYGSDTAERMLLRNGVIDEIPTDRCDARDGKTKKNVFLVVGDGMGWEMVRAGAIARQVLDELEGMGCDTKVGCPEMTTANEAFEGRTLSDYYTEGQGSGLSFQELPGFALVTTTAPVLQSPNDGNHYASAATLLEGSASSHNDRQSTLVMNECGFPWELNPTSVDVGGDLALWDNVKGGMYPWDANYYTETPDTSSGFDPEFIMQHATDSASTASAYATGVKTASGVLSQDLYENDVPTILEDAMRCGMAAGVVTSVPMFHATPGAFIIHSNNRSNRDQLRTNWKVVNPTFVSGACGGRYYPFEEDLQSMIDGSLSSQWTLLAQDDDVLAADFYNGIGDLDPDNGDHVMVCLAGDFSASGETNLPYRGVDSSYSDRWCSSGSAVTDPDTGDIIGVNVTTDTELCDHFSAEEIEHIPTIMENVEAAIDFLSKDDDGFFLMYEQGDIDWAAHANHMDDLLGAMLDVDDSVRIIMNWIEANGGWEKNALYVTADHDHYLTLANHFPEALAKLLIAGESHNITPYNNTNVNAWSMGVAAGRADDDSQSQTEHLDDFSTWSDEEIEMVAHFFGPRGSGGNGWGSHSTRPIPMSYGGDDGCVESLTGATYRMVGKEVEGNEGKVDEVHVHACMMKNLFGL